MEIPNEIPATNLPDEVIGITACENTNNCQIDSKVDLQVAKLAYAEIIKAISELRAKLSPEHAFRIEYPDTIIVNSKKFYFGRFEEPVPFN